MTSLDHGRTSEAEGAERLPFDACVEALLFAADRPISEPRLREVLASRSDGDTPDAIADAIGRLNASYEAHGRAFRIERLAGGWRVLTRPEFHGVVEALRGDRQQSKLSPAALECLSIIAYRQPILRAELEAIRGVSCGEVLKTLLDRRLVKITGRAEILGRPMLYGTTREFLQVFGLASLDDLPAVAADRSVPASSQNAS